MARCQERQESTSLDGGEGSHDHLKWQGTRHFTTTIAQIGSPEEEIKYSGWVEKINNKGAVQPRVMVITNLAVYNFKSRLTIQCKRRIDICLIVHIVRSKYSHQFLLCCPQEYDYLYSSVQVSEICDILVAAHRVVTGNTISVEIKVSEDLSEFVLTRQEAKKIRKEHPELGAKSASADGEQVQEKTANSTNLLNSSTPAQQEKMNRMSWGGEEPTVSASTKLLPDHHVPSVQLTTTSRDADGDIESLKVLKVIDEVYVVKSKKTGEVFALKSVESRSNTSVSSSNSFFSRCFRSCYQQQLCISLVFFQIVIFCTFCLALRYIVTSCYKG